MVNLLRRANRIFAKLRDIIADQQAVIISLQALSARQEAFVKDLNEQFATLQATNRQQQELLGHSRVYVEGDKTLGDDLEEDKNLGDDLEPRAATAPFSQMAPASNEEQFKFLISCIRYSNNGKVDFEAVRMECNICSKGAAAKRYERMMKAHGIYQTNSTIADTPIPSTKPKTSSSATATNPTNPTSSKKRKHAQFVETNANTDDDEGLSKVKPEPPNQKIKGEAVKEESTDNQASPQALTSAKEKTPSKYTMGLDDVDDSAIFRDFLSFGAFGGQDVGSKDMFGATAGLDVKPVKGVVPESIVINE